MSLGEDPAQAANASWYSHQFPGPIWGQRIFPMLTAFSCQWSPCLTCFWLRRPRSETQCGPFKKTDKGACAAIQCRIIGRHHMQSGPGGNHRLMRITQLIVLGNPGALSRHPGFSFSECFRSLPVGDFPLNLQNNSNKGEKVCEFCSRSHWSAREF